MDSDTAAWLRQQREDRGWSKAEMARRLVQAGRAAGDTAVPELSGMLHNIHRWEREGGISERHKLHYCRAFGIHPSQFGLSTGEPAQAAAPAPLRRGRPCRPGTRPAPSRRRNGRPVPPTPAGIAYRGRQEPVLRDFAVEHEVMMAAHEGSDHAAEHEQPRHRRGHAGAAPRGPGPAVRPVRYRRAAARVPGHAPGPRPHLPAAGPAGAAPRRGRAVLPARLPARADGPDRQPPRLPRRRRGTAPGRLGLRQRDRPQPAARHAAREALLRHVLARPVHRQPRPGGRRPAVRLAGPGRRQPAP